MPVTCEACIALSRFGDPNSLKRSSENSVESLPILYTIQIITKSCMQRAVQLWRNCSTIIFSTDFRLYNSTSIFWNYRKIHGRQRNHAKKKKERIKLPRIRKNSTNRKRNYPSILLITVSQWSKALIRVAVTRINQ